MHIHSVQCSLPGSVSRCACLGAVWLLTTGGLPQAANGQGHCTPVGGTVMTNFINETTTLGTATGDIRCAVSATLLDTTVEADGTAVFSVQHHWVTDSGDTIVMPVAQARATLVAPGLFAVIAYPLTIDGGTGKFARATGTIRSIGEIDLNSRRTVFRYAGEICVRGRPY